MGSGSLSRAWNDTNDRERVRGANPLHEVVQDYFPLIQDGKNFKALCPFHSEKSPSFKINPDSEHYHCFGCQERGDVFSFVQKIESLDFVEALKFLAERAGVTLEPVGRGRASRGSSPDGAQLRKARGYEVLDKTRLWFQAQLWSESSSQLSYAKEAREYLLSRGFRPETLRDFGVGLAQLGWSELITQLQRDQVSESEAIAVGVARPRKSGGAFDFFRGRVMFPIRGLQGRTVGFGGRIFGGGEDRKDEGKYWNSPESPFFSKGQILYGLFEGRESIRRDRKLLLMEGYTDVMMAHQAGFPHAVATLGTALAEPNVEQVCRHSDEVTLVFDGDKAGRSAARKAVWLFLPRSIGVRVVLLPEGADPGDLLSDPEGRVQFQRALERGREPLEFVLDELVEEFGVATGERRTRLAREFFPYLERVSSEFTKLEGVRSVAQRLSSQEEIVLREYRRWMGGLRGARRPSAPATNTSEPVLPGYEDAIVLCALSMRERAQAVFALQPPDQLRDPILRSIAQVIEAAADAGKDLVTSVDFEVPEVKSRYLGLAAQLEGDAYSEEQAARLFRDLLVQVLTHRGRELRNRLKGSLAEGEQVSAMAELVAMRIDVSRLRGGTLTSWNELEKIRQRVQPDSRDSMRGHTAVSPKADFPSAEERGGVSAVVE